MCMCAQYRYIFITYFAALFRHWVFYKLKVYGNPEASRSNSTIFPRAYAHFMSLHHILKFLQYFKLFHCHIVTLAYDQWFWWYYCNCLQCQRPHTCQTSNLINCWNNNKGLRILHKPLVNKAVAGYERTHSNFERFTVDKILSNSIACYRETVLKGFMQQIHRCLILRNCHNHPSL